MVLQSSAWRSCIIFPSISLWFPQWLQARRLAERNAQIEYVAPPQNAAAALDGSRATVRNF